MIGMIRIKLKVGDSKILDNKVKDLRELDSLMAKVKKKLG